MLSCDFLKVYQWVRRADVKGGGGGGGGGGGLEATTVCYILCLFGQGNFIFIRESRNFAH